MDNYYRKMQYSYKITSKINERISKIRKESPRDTKFSLTIETESYTKEDVDSIVTRNRLLGFDAHKIHLRSLGNGVYLVLVKHEDTFEMMLTALDGIRLPTNCSRIFAGLHVHHLDLSQLDTGYSNDMTGMFGGCSKLETLDLSTFDTSGVTSMEYMFCGCSDLEEINLSSFNTRNVQNMHGMFYDCNWLKHVDLSSFDTSKVKNMGYMFNACRSLKELDLSNFDTSKVTDMSWMFRECPSLKTVDLGSFSISQATDIYCMFTQCRDLTTEGIKAPNEVLEMIEKQLEN